MAYKTPEETLNGPQRSAVYDLAYGAAINTGATHEEADAAANEAEGKSVFGFDAKKDRNGNWIPQGIGAPGNESSNHYAALRKAEQQDLEPPGSYNRAVIDLYRRDAAKARSLGLREPNRA
jgi:hypothetical protein